MGKTKRFTKDIITRNVSTKDFFKNDFSEIIGKVYSINEKSGIYKVVLRNLFDNEIIKLNCQVNETCGVVYKEDYFLIRKYNNVYEIMGTYKKNDICGFKSYNPFWYSKEDKSVRKILRRRIRRNNKIRLKIFDEPIKETKTCGWITN